VSRDAPEAAKEELRLLTYTGVLMKIDDGIKGTSGHIGARYAINVGCLVASETNPIEIINELPKTTIKRFTEFGATNPVFQEVADAVKGSIESDISVRLPELLSRSIDELDLSQHQNKALHSLGIATIGKALSSTEQDFQAAHYIGPKRSRRMMNVVSAAALEYLSG